MALPSPMCSLQTCNSLAGGGSCTGVSHAPSHVLGMHIEQLTRQTLGSPMPLRRSAYKRAVHLQTTAATCQYEDNARAYMRCTDHIYTISFRPCMCTASAQASASLEAP